MVEIKKYIIDHCIHKIGTIVPGYVCTEVIVDNPQQLIEICFKNNCYISHIAWWDRVEISSRSSIGYGGSRDPRDPNRYFFAETDICKTFKPLTPIMEYYKYLEETKNNFSAFDLYPAFDIINQYTNL